MTVAKRKTRTSQNERFAARVSREKKALLKRAAKIRGSSLTEFVLNSAIEAAERTIKEAEFMELTQRDRIAFVQALLQPAASPNVKLRSAAGRHTRMFPRS